MSTIGRAAKAAFRTTWGPHDSDTAQAFRWSVVGEDYERKARAAVIAALDPDDAELVEATARGIALDRFSVRDDDETFDNSTVWIEKRWPTFVDTARAAIAAQRNLLQKEQRT